MCVTEKRESLVSVLQVPPGRSARPHTWRHKARACGLAVLVCLLVCCQAWGDIEVRPQYEPHEPIVATVTITDVPDGAKLRGSFAVSDGEYLPAGENVYHVWAKPGQHTLTAQGVWVVTRDVTVGDQTFPILVDFGQFSYSKTITVGEAVPPVPPPPPGNRRAVILEESQERTPQQSLLFDQLQLKLGSKIQVWDDDQPGAQPYLKLAKSTARPLLVVLTDAGQLVRESSVPSSVAAVEQEISR